MLPEFLLAPIHFLVEEGSFFIRPTIGTWKILNVALVTAFIILVDFTPGGRENCIVAAELIENQSNADNFFFVTVMQSSSTPS